jgi:hypothetical protein
MDNKSILESARRYAQEEPDANAQAQVTQWVDAAVQGDE